MVDEVTEQGGAPVSMYSVEQSDPLSELIDREHLTPTDVEEINRLMAAMAALRRSEDHLTDVSQRYMQLGKSDMRALHFLIVAQHGGRLVKPRDIADHLEISTASVTKLLDRLEAGHHITRAIHPTDRRSQSIEITRETRDAAMRTVGKQQAKRFHVAAARTSAERIAIAQFLEEMAHELVTIDDDWESH